MNQKFFGKGKKKFILDEQYSGAVPTPEKLLLAWIWRREKK